jgi:alkanesulfonate monooxygenase SsuD/methylene tetrahydromethanopterin reductase-like flavin-dependent oxidoreductase (luciferase family)
MPAPMIAAQAQQLEAMGLEGVFAPQVYGPPWIPLAVAAGATNRMKLASGIALAFARSPFETAVAAMDMDTISEGRLSSGWDRASAPGARASSACPTASPSSTSAKSSRSSGSSSPGATPAS